MILRIGLVVYIILGHGWGLCGGWIGGGLRWVVEGLGLFIMVIVDRMFYGKSRLITSSQPQPQYPSCCKNFPKKMPENSPKSDMNSQEFCRK